MEVLVIGQGAQDNHKSFEMIKVGVSAQKMGFLVFTYICIYIHFSLISAFSVKYWMIWPQTVHK